MDANLPLPAASDAGFPWLSLIVLLPAAAALLMPLLPGEDQKPSPIPRNLTLAVLLADLGLMMAAFSRHYDPFEQPAAAGGTGQLGSGDRPGVVTRC